MLVGYMRVSTNGDRQVLDLQRDALLAAGVDERNLFEDRVTGSRVDRTGLTKALAFIRPGDCLVVWKLDRLGRSLPHLLTTVTDLKKRGVAFRSLTEQMDTTTPQGEFLFHIFGSLAQFERSLIRERVQAGLAAAQRRGRHGGRPAVIDAEKLAAVTAALDGGATKAAVCRTFGIKRSTLIDCLRSGFKVYTHLSGLGRLERTLFTLDWIEDPELRRETGQELNKGESRNSLARAVFIHRLGEIRDRTYENQQHRASGLNLLVTAIILWNTRYLERAVAVLRQTEDVPDHLLAHLSPLGWEHINLTGDYIWIALQNVSENNDGLSPLRTAPEVFAKAA